MTDDERERLAVLRAVRDCDEHLNLWTLKRVIGGGRVKTDAIFEAGHLTLQHDGAAWGYSITPAGVAELARLEALEATCKT